MKKRSTGGGRFQCFECGKRAEHAHHVVPYSLGGRKTIPLCNKCHSLSHGGLYPFNHGKLIRKSLLKAKAHGVILGAPVTAGKQRGEAKRLHAKGIEPVEIAKELHVSRASVYRFLKPVVRKPPQKPL